MILIPLILTTLTFLMVGTYMVRNQENFRQAITQEVEERTQIDIGKFLEEPMEGFEKLIAPSFFKSMIFSIIII